MTSSRRLTTALSLALATTLAWHTFAAEDDPAAQTQLDAANGIFAKDFHELALAEYGKYLQWFPNAKGVEEAAYRSAECLRALGKAGDARAGYKEVLRRFPAGPFAARAEFRLAEMLVAEGKPAEAVPRFAAAASRAKEDPTRLAARFSQAHLLLKLGRPGEAAPPLRELAREERGNPYRGFALIELGRIVEAAGQLDEARLLYGKALETDAASELRAEAGLRAAAIEVHAERWGAAAALIEKTRRFLPPGDPLARANWTLLSCYWRLGQHEAVTRMAADPKLDLPAERRGDAALLGAHSLRALARPVEAAAAYGAFTRAFPKHPEATSAACERVICLAAANAPGWENEATAFLRASPKAAGASRVLYLLADRAFARGDFVVAAAAYAQIQPATLDPALTPEVSFRWGASLAKAGRHADAMARLDEFMKKFPAYPLVPQGLALLGLSAQQLGNHEAALKAFQDLADHFPKAPEREDALRRIALLNGALGRPAALREGYERLAKEYPKSRWLDEAAYWTGASFFDEKKFAEAIAPLERARAMNAAAFGANATSRLILSRWFLRQRAALAKELLALPEGTAPPSPEIWDWTARQSAAEGDHAVAVQLFARIIAHPAGAPFRHAARRALAASLGAQGRWKAAAESLETYVTEAADPDDSVAGRLDLARARTALKEFDKARELAEGVMTEQPEGRANADARMLLGEVLDAEGKPGEAAKQWLSVAILYADPQVTPDAYTRAAGAFERAGDTNEAARLRKELAEKYPDTARAKP